MRPDLYPDEYNASDSLLVAFGFRCNLACTFCMVEDVLDVDRGCDLDSFRRFSADSEAMRGIRRIIFSGGEATMERDLLDYVTHARTISGIEHVRIQTNATRLRDRRYLATLLDAGVDEFFVSLHGHDAPTCDAITERPGSFGRILDGIAALAESTATLITNTVIARPNHAHLADIVEIVARYRPKAMEFWNIWPRVAGHGTRKMIVGVTDAQAPLLAALEAAEDRGIETVVKFYPRCLLGRFESRHDDTQPTALIDAHYWNRDPRYDCLYAGICDDAQSGCSGLSHVYVEELGWEENALRPRRGDRRFDPTPTEPDVEEVVPRDVPSGEVGPTEGLAAWLESLELPLGSEIAGWKLNQGRIAPHAVRLQLERGPHRLLLSITARDDARPCYARTASFDISHARMSDDSRRIVGPVLEAFVARLQAKDAGGRSLPTAAAGARGEERAGPYAVRGYVHVPGLVDGPTIRRLLDATVRLAAEAPTTSPDSFETALRQSSFGAAVFWDPALGDPSVVPPSDRWSRLSRIGHALHLAEPAVRLLLSSEAILACVRTAISSPVVLLTSVIICKQPSGSVEFGPHQDTTYLHSQPEQLVSLMIALDDADEQNGCLRVAPGSHQLPTRVRARPGPNDWIEERLDDHAVPECAEAIVMRSGDGVLYDGRLYHASSTNRSSAPRRALIAQYSPAHVEWSATNWLEPPPGGFVRVG